MTTEEPRVSDGARLTKAEACRVLDVCPRTLDRYARHFGEAPHVNTITNRPVYYGHQLKRIWRCVR